MSWTTKLRSLRWPALIGIGTVAVTLSSIKVMGRGVMVESYVFFSIIALAFVGAVASLFRSIRALADESNEEVALEAKSSIAELDYEKRRLLASLKELEFDLGMDKISREDYDELSAYYERRAIEAMQALDRAQGRAVTGGPGPKDIWRMRAEAALAERLRGAGKAPLQTFGTEQLVQTAAAVPATATKVEAASVEKSATEAKAPVVVEAKAPVVAVAEAKAVVVEAKAPEVPVFASAVVEPGKPAAEVATPEAVPAALGDAAKCPSCSAPVDADSIFCKRCGQRVETVPRATGVA